MGQNNLKGQFWSFDVIFAIVIFTVAITILTFTWYNINNQLSLAYGNGALTMQLQDHALIASLLSQGSPSSWQDQVNTTNTSTWGSVGIGILGSNGEISMSKLYALVAMSNYNPEATEQPLGIGYNYYIIIDGKNINIRIGSSPLGRSLTTYVARSSSILSGQPVQVEVILWTAEPTAVE